MTTATSAIGSTKPNVVFVIVDDLRSELGCYGNAEIKTPGFDRFAKQAVRFSRAYCQAAACAPSRASVMTGLRPDTTRVWDLRGKFRVNMPEVVTLPQHFKKHGYHTVSLGKIFHNHMPDRVSFDEPERCQKSNRRFLGLSVRIHKHLDIKVRCVFHQDRPDFGFFFCFNILMAFIWKGLELHMPLVMIPFEMGCLRPSFSFDKALFNSESSLRPFRYQ
jgi:hypothetical protein